MKLAFVPSPSQPAHDAVSVLRQKYGIFAPEDADCVVAVGGDGIVLKTLYALMPGARPVFALRKTDSVGFLCNDYRVEDLPERVAQAHKVLLHPLRAEARLENGTTETALAINEVSVLRDSPQSAKLRILVDGVERLAKYSGDGLLVATPAGSPAYNHSSGGPIMPLDSNTLVMTAICGFRPRRWSYAVLPQDAAVDIEVLEIAKRPVRMEAGPHTFRHVTALRITLNQTVTCALLFDPDKHLGERIIQEQFMT